MVESSAGCTNSPGYKVRVASYLLIEHDERYS